MYHARFPSLKVILSKGESVFLKLVDYERKARFKIGNAKKLGNAKPVFILINPDTKTISAIDYLEQNQILDLLQDEAVDIKSIGKMQIITGLKALSSPNIPATLLQIGSGETVRINGPALLIPKRGYFWDEMIIESLVDDLLQTATFFDPANESSGL